MLQILRQLSLKFYNSADDHTTLKNVAHVLGEVFAKAKTMHKGSEFMNSLLDVSTIDSYFKLLKVKVIYLNVAGYTEAFKRIQCQCQPPQ